MKRYSRTWLFALSLALVLLNVSSWLGNARLAQESNAARQQAAVWKAYALTAHGPGLRAVDLEDRAMAGTREPSSRLSF